MSTNEDAHQQWADLAERQELPTAKVGQVLRGADAAASGRAAVAAAGVDPAPFTTGTDT